MVLHQLNGSVITIESPTKTIKVTTSTPKEMSHSLGRELNLRNEEQRARCLVLQIVNG